MSNIIELNINESSKIITKNNKKYRISIDGFGSGSISIFEIIDINYNKINNNYLISNSNELLCLMAHGDSNYYNILNNPKPNFQIDAFLQISNIDISEQYNPIMLNTFSGIYDGNNYELQNINIKRDLITTKINMGLFTTLSNATIKNIKITGKTTITDNSDDIAGCDFGFISNYAENSIIQDCIVSASLSNVRCMSFGGIVKEAKNSIILRNNFNCSGDININDIYSGGIVAKAENTKILFNTNSMKGNINSTCIILGGIYGGNSNGNNYIYGNLNIMKGDINNNSDTNGCIQGQSGINDIIKLNINAMFGNLNSTGNKNGAIVGDALLNSEIIYNINAQNGNINGSGIVDYTGSNTLLEYNLNTMKGICTHSAGIKYIDNFDILKIRNNLVMMRGYANLNEASIADCTAYLNYGFSNSTSIPLLTTSNPLFILEQGDYYKYYNNSNYSDLPIMNFDYYKEVNIDSVIYSGPAPYWSLYFPNINDTHIYSFSSNNIYLPRIITNSKDSWLNFIKI